MVIDCSLNSFTVPGFSGVNPPFGTKKAADQPVTSREANVNIMMPFMRQRPFAVAEDSTTTAIEADSVFALQASGIVLTLNSGAFAGCRARAVNVADDVASLAWTDGEEKTIDVSPGKEVELVWNGSAWKKVETGGGSGGASSKADMVEGLGRNLFDVLGATSILGAMTEIRRRCNNNGEIDSSGVPDFSSLEVGDYIDGLDLSGIAATTGGTAPQAWNDAYKNNRLVVSGFNTFKEMGDVENAKNHVLFTFRNIIAKGRMNAANDNTGGYAASELRAWLEGATGDGSGVFATGLKLALGGNFLYTVRKAHSKKSTYAWGAFTVWPPSELEVFGVPLYGDEGVYMPAITTPAIEARVGYLTPIQLPIFQKSYVYRIKRWNGSRDWWWELTPRSDSAASFCLVHYFGYSNSHSASSAGGCAPAFCVA
ncbi:MAG: DUF6273 domain-containing protein [Spirochaetaceae bacterium]|jgi:hypothetical protein|nr:DUF6273 domain-containing protein [Spirochaetaceae bacterium]